MISEQDFYQITGKVITLISGIQKGMTTEEVKQEIAIFLDVTIDQLKRYEAGEDKISLYQFFCLCEAYNFPFFVTKSVIGNCDEKLLKLYSDFLPTREDKNINKDTNKNEIPKRQRG